MKKTQRNCRIEKPPNPRQAWVPALTLQEDHSREFSLPRFGANPGYPHSDFQNSQNPLLSIKYTKKKTRGGELNENVNVFVSKAKFS